MHLTIGTAGHIDHGKSALVQALTGIDPDRLKEEKARGITIDLGFAHCRIGGIDFSFVDVPGHERFVKNMLAGASGIDAVLLVIAADESVMPQTREHFDICRLLRVGSGIIVLTKADLVDADTLELVRLEARELVAGSFLGAAPMVAVSARTGAGLDELRAALQDLPRSGSGRLARGGARLPIDRVFSVKGFGTVVTGTLASGRLADDDELQLLPSDRRVKVRGLQVHGEKAGEASAGQRTAANLGGVDLDEVVRGETLASPGTLEPTRRFDALMELLPGARPLRHGARVRFHQGTVELLGRVALSVASVGRSAGEGGEASEVAPGERAYVRIRLESPAVLTRGDRFILRAYSPPVTIAGGEVLDPQPPRSGIRTEAGRDRLRTLDARQPDGSRDHVAAVRTMIAERGAVGLTVSELTSRAGLAPEDRAGFVERLVRAGAGVRIGDRLVAPAVLDALQTKLLALLAEYHRKAPLSEGLSREEARERLFSRAHPSVFERTLADLVQARRIVARDHLALATHQLSLSDEEHQARQGLEDAFRQSGLRPPDAGALAAALAVPPAVVDRVLKLLLRQKVLVRIDSLVFHAEALEELKREMARLKEAGTREIDVAMFKERYEVTRKYAIPLLEYLDRERVTRRAGEKRVLL